MPRFHSEADFADGPSENALGGGAEEEEGEEETRAGPRLLPLVVVVLLIIRAKPGTSVSLPR